MKTYEITVTEIDDEQKDRYQDHLRTKIYNQIVLDLDLISVIKAVNKIEDKEHVQ